jgi:hypothetical protein
MDPTISDPATIGDFEVIGALFLLVMLGKYVLVHLSTVFALLLVLFIGYILLRKASSGGA